jgi:hypothetical protein
MTLRDHLLDRRDALTTSWFDRVLTAYPPDTARVLARNTGSFGNPMGQTYARALAAVFQGIVAGEPPARVRPHIDDVVRVRAVQDMTPGVALAFLFQLKDLLREEADRLGGGRAGGTADELREIEDRIDGALLMAFDLYTACREQVHRLKSRQHDIEQEMATPGRPGNRSRGPADASRPRGTAADPEV